MTLQEAQEFKRKTNAEMMKMWADAGVSVHPKIIETRANLAKLQADTQKESE